MSEPNENHPLVPDKYKVNKYLLSMNSHPQTTGTAKYISVLVPIMENNAL